MPSRASCLVYYIVWIEGEFEEIITKIRLSFKDNNNYLQSKFH